MDFNLHCPCFHKGSLVTVPGVPWFKDPALRSQETSLQSSNGREVESNDVTRGESAGGLPTSPAVYLLLRRVSPRYSPPHPSPAPFLSLPPSAPSAHFEDSVSDIELFPQHSLLLPSTGKTPAPHPPRRSGTLEIAGLDASLESSSPRGGGGEVDNLAASTTSDQRAGTPGARDAKAPDDRPIPPAGAGAPATLPARRPPVPGSRDPGRSRSALPARTVPSRRLLTGATARDASRGAAGSPRAPRKPPPIWRPEPPPPPPHLPGTGKWPGAPNLPHSLQGANFHSRTRRDRLAAPASASRYGACARRPRPTRARELARGARWEREFSRRCRRGRGGGGVRSPTPGALTCRHLSLPQYRLRPLRTLPRPSHSIPAVARAKKRGVSSDCSLFHTPCSQSSDPACSTGKYVQNPTTSHANTRPAGAPPPFAWIIEKVGQRASRSHARPPPFRYLSTQWPAGPH
nr:nascent polypeptide-associated complex subunit alpha, muscle-specific form-like [Globicephala melas]